MAQNTPTASGYHAWVDSTGVQHVDMVYRREEPRNRGMAREVPRWFLKFSFGGVFYRVEDAKNKPWFGEWIGPVKFRKNDNGEWVWDKD